MSFIDEESIVAQDRYDVIVYSRHISLDVVIPENFAWEFMAEFGRAFVVKDSVEGTEDLKSVDSYVAQAGGWHIRVSVWENDEGKFYKFLEDFCFKRSLLLRDPV